jgi:flagellar motor switch protein FliG
VALTGKQKAALLLMSLDAVTATELLKGLTTEAVQELAVELAHLDAVGYRNSKQSTEIAQQFVNRLQPGQGFNFKSLLKGMLKNPAVKEKAKRIGAKIDGFAQRCDPFIRIRKTDSQTIASILEDEHPQATAVVLSELSTRKSTEVLGFLGEGIRLSAASRMTGAEQVPSEAKAQIAETVCKRLEAIAACAGAVLSH